MAWSFKAHVEGITFDDTGKFQQIASTGLSQADIVLEFDGISSQQQVRLDLGGNSGDGTDPAENAVNAEKSTGWIRPRHLDLD